MKSYKKTYFLQSILELPNILLMVSLTLCPPMFVACLFDNYGLIKSFLMILVFPIVLSIVYLIIYLPMLLINLIIWIFIKPSISINVDSINNNGKERLFKNLAKIEFSIGYRSPTVFVLISKNDIHPPFRIKNHPLKIIKFLKNKFGDNFVNKDKKSNKIFTIICAVLGIILTVIILVNFL